MADEKADVDRERKLAFEKKAMKAATSASIPVKAPDAVQASIIHSIAVLRETPKQVSVAIAYSRSFISKLTKTSFHSSPLCHCKTAVHLRQT